MVIRELVLLKYGNKCAYCGDSITITNFHVDHIQPKKGVVKGENKIDNYNPACCSCNCSKSNLTVSEWREKLQTRFTQLEENTPYRILKRLGKIKENEKPITFYFETL